jgi:hypothetical protein
MRTTTRAGSTLGWACLAYALASLAHFAHNAEYLADYPNLPAWLSRAQVYGVWLAITGLGAVGYALYRRGYELLGLLAIFAYAALGFDGLLHYTRAPLGAHTAAMNFTIWTEVAAAALLLFTAALLLVTRRPLVEP